MFLSMAMTMHKAALMLACLACTSHGRRVQFPAATDADSSGSKSAPALQTPLHSNNRRSRGNNKAPLIKALGVDLLAVQPVRAQRAGSSPVADRQRLKAAKSHRRGLLPEMLKVVFADTTHVKESAMREAIRELAKQEEERERLLAEIPDVQIEDLKKKEVLDAAYAKCEKITTSASKSFSFATKFLNEDQKRAVWAIYTWCRRTDDIVDSPLAMMSPQTMRANLTAWHKRLDETWNGEVQDTLDLALYETKVKYPTLAMEPFVDMLKGMLMDTDYGQKRYETFDDLYLYCYRVASTVGLMTLPVFGTCKGVREEQAREPAIALGIALQLTNILRDVGEDARRGRIYLPLEDLRRFRVTEKQILSGIVDDNYVALMQFEILRAREWYKRAQAGIPMLHPSARVGVQAAGDIYGGILEKLEEIKYDNFRNRAYVPKPEKLYRLFGSWKKTWGMPTSTLL